MENITTSAKGKHGEYTFSMYRPDHVCITGNLVYRGINARLVYHLMFKDGEWKKDHFTLDRMEFDKTANRFISWKANDAVMLEANTLWEQVRTPQLLLKAKIIQAKQQIKAACEQRDKLARELAEEKEKIKVLIEILREANANHD